MTAGITQRGLGDGLLFLFLLVVDAAQATAQVRVMGELAVVGTVEAVTAEGIVVRDESDTRHEILVQGPTQQGIAITGGGLLAAHADVRVTSQFPVAGLKPGQVVRVSCRLDRHGKTTGTVTELAVLDDDAGGVGVEPALDATPAGAAEFPERVVTGRVKAATASRVVIELPDGSLPGGRTTISCQCAAGTVARLESRDPGRIEPGARVSRLSALRLSTGDLVTRTLVVENPAAKAVADKGDDALERKYRQFSDQPPDRPRLVRSRHFAFMTDVSDREWAVIRDKLERMVKALEGCLGRPMTDEYKVEGFVVRDLARFPAGLIDDPFGVEKISRGEGVCVNSQQGRLRHARLYSCADHGVIQHECVHGICHLTFGSAGPTWLAEGLAELGSYWREDDQTV
ncbi:MAG: hypothetical protein FJ284_11420, partial [Planctomycetes bacterium]|nr:hypothetical protein [Planctomycetota bacterium]